MKRWLLVKKGRSVGEDDEFYFISSFGNTVLHHGSDLQYYMSSKKCFLKEVLFHQSDVDITMHYNITMIYNIYCNVDIINNLLHQNEYLPKCYQSKTAYSKHLLHVLWECKGKGDVSS